MPTDGDYTARARAWHRAALAAACDLMVPWAHGTVVRASRYPTYFDLNAVRVEDAAPPATDELVAFADEALAEPRHRRVDFEVAVGRRPAPARVRGARLARHTRLVWMRHGGETLPGEDVAVTAVPYDAVRELRHAWHHEDFPDQDPGGALRGRPRSAPPGAGARRARRGRAGGVRAARARRRRRRDRAGLRRAGVPRRRPRDGAHARGDDAAAGDVRDLWIIADDEDRPKLLYARLGFRPAWTALEFLRLP